jgi:hypothetical protein
MTPSEISSPQVFDGIIANAQKTRDRGLDWMLERVDGRGSVVGGHPGHAYDRVPWTLTVAGHRRPATSVLEWMEAEVLGADGDYRPGPPRERYAETYSAYLLPMVVIASVSLGRYDLANRVFQRITSSYIDKTSGGCLVGRSESRLANTCELFPSSQFGLAALALGRSSEAERTFEFHRSLYLAQTNLPDRLYTSWETVGLVTDFPDEEAFGRVTDFTERRQAFYNPGIAAAFLAQYAMFADSSDALDLADKFLRLTFSGGSQQFEFAESVQVCKYGWGAAAIVIAGATDPWADEVIRMSQWFADCQLDDGRWQNSRFLTPDPTDADDMVITAEFVLIMDFILGALGAMAARSDKASM